MSRVLQWLTSMRLCVWGWGESPRSLSGWTYETEKLLCSWLQLITMKNYRLELAKGDKKLEVITHRGQNYFGKDLSMT